MADVEWTSVSDEYVALYQQQFDLVMSSFGVPRHLVDSMTEQEWLASDDPAAMLRYVSGTEGGPRGNGHRLVSDRKLRLFACACCYQAWDKLTDERSRRAVEVASRFADRQATDAERDGVMVAILLDPEVNDDDPRYDGLVSAAWTVNSSSQLSENAAHYLSRVTRLGVPLAAQAALLRDIIGNPFRPVTRESIGVGDWYASQWELILDLSRAAYDGRAGRACGRCGGKGRTIDAAGSLDDCPDCGGTGRIKDGHLDPARFAVLSDALEDAGCADEAILMHLRGKEHCWCGNLHTNHSRWQPLRGPHVRGCWALDLLLGKQ